jgi:hypothetical protein
MNGLIPAILLKHKHTRAFVVIGVIFHNDCGSEAAQEIIDEQVIVCQLVIPMIRDLHLPSDDQLTNPLKRSAHHTSGRDTSRLSEMPSYMRHPIYSRPFNLKHVKEI